MALSYTPVTHLLFDICREIKKRERGRILTKKIKDTFTRRLRFLFVTEEQASGFVELCMYVAFYGNLLLVYYGCVVEMQWTPFYKLLI